MRSLVLAFVALGVAGFAPAQFGLPAPGVDGIRSALRDLERAHGDLQCRLPPLSPRAVEVARLSREMAGGSTEAQRRALDAAYLAVEAETEAGRSCYDRYEEVSVEMIGVERHLASTYRTCRGPGAHAFDHRLSPSCIEAALPASLRPRYLAAVRRHQTLTAPFEADQTLLRQYADLYAAPRRSRVWEDYWEDYWEY